MLKNEKFVCKKYKLFEVAFFTPWWSKLHFFKKKSANFVFFSISIFINLFMASNKLLDGYTKNISLKKQVQCLMFIVLHMDCQHDKLLLFAK